MILMLRCDRLNRINRVNNRKSHVPESIDRSIVISDKSDNAPIDDDHSMKVRKPRIERSVVTLESNNVTDVTTIGDILGSDGRGGRAKREEVRGKQRRKMKRRPKRSRRRLGTLGRLLLLLV